METEQHGRVVKELKALLTAGNAHATFEDSVADLPADLRGKTPDNLPYSIWQLVEHIRIAQKDILDFSTSEAYEALNWPDDYWPEPTENVTDEMWNGSLKAITEDRNEFLKLLENGPVDIYTPLPWGNGQTLIREAMLISDHNAYHTAEIIVIRRLLRCWKSA